MESHELVGMEVTGPHPKRKWVVEVRTQSWGYYEVEADTQVEAVEQDPDKIRAGKVISFREEVNVTNSMEIRNP